LEFRKHIEIDLISCLKIGCFENTEITVYQYDTIERLYTESYVCKYKFTLNLLFRHIYKTRQKTFTTVEVGIRHP